MTRPAPVPGFTVAGSAGFHRWLARRLEELAGDVQDALGDRLCALLLGGGYGRGEGAVVRAGGVERPYNDLDLVVVVRSKHGVGRRLAPVARRHRELLGIEVDFSRPLTPQDVARWEPRLRWYELVHGHVVLAGDAGLVDRLAPRRVREPVPEAEAAPLLLNRGAGLLWAARVRRGLEPAPDPDFVRRNAYKALLAVGDAYLIAHGSLRPGHRGRVERLRAIRYVLPEAFADRLLVAYARAVTFKLTPDMLPPGEEAAGAAEALWLSSFLDLESRRHRVAFSGPAAYAAWDAPRELLTFGRRCRFLLTNLRHGLLSARSPRERLYRELPVLLDPGGGGADWERRSARFLRLWRRVND